MIDSILKYLIVILAATMFILEYRSCGMKYVKCDEGKFTCVKRFLGGEPIYKHTDSTWWLWPEESEICGTSVFPIIRVRRKMIICHNCEFINPKAQPQAAGKVNQGNQ